MSQQIRDLVQQGKYVMDYLKLAAYFYRNVEDLLTINISNIQTGTGVIFLHEADGQLLQVLRSAIEQCGYSGTLNNMLWMKTLPDGTKLALVIHYYNDNPRFPLIQHAKYARNITILTANGSNNMKAPVIVDSIYKDSSRDNSNASRFNLPFGTTATTCEMMFEREQRMESELTPRHIKAVEAVQQAKYLLTKYFVIASPNHQHQLALFLNSVTPYFPTPFEKRILIYRFRKDTPADLPCLTEPLKKAGVDVSILFKASNDHWICHYIYVDALFYILQAKARELFQPLRPWMIGLDPPCWKFTETLLNHQRNARIGDDIRYVMELMQSAPCLGGDPKCCAIHDDVHKLLKVE